MSVGDAIVIESLPSAVPGVPRMLCRTAGGVLEEAVELPADRLSGLPQGGVFSEVRVVGARTVLGPPMRARLSDLSAPPTVVLGLLMRVLEDLEELHRAGGAHGALALEGFGIDEAGVFRIRPSFHLPGEHTQRGDIHALGSVLATLAPPDVIAVARAPFLYSGFGIDAPRARFSDARAARQALSVVVRGLGVQEACVVFLSAHQARLPSRPGPFRARPVAGAPTEAGDSRTRDAREWLHRSLAEARSVRYEREAKLEAESERLAGELRIMTETTIAAARAVAEREAAIIALQTRQSVPAMLFPGDALRTRPKAPEPRPAATEAEADEETLDAASAGGVDVADLLDVVDSSRGQDGGDSRAEAQADDHVEPDTRRLRAREAALAEARRLQAREASLAQAEREAAAEAEAAQAAATEAAQAAAEAEAAQAAATEAAQAAATEAAQAAATEAAQAAATEAAQAAATEAEARLQDRERRALEALALAEAELAARAAEADDEGLADEPPGTGIARWDGAVGVRGDPARMNEKGPGKWTLQGRSREELAAQLPPGESRGLDLTPQAAGLPWTWILAGTTALMLAGYLVFG